MVDIYEIVCYYIDVHNVDVFKEGENMEGNALRGAVAEKYGSCAKFADALNWSKRKTCDIVSGRQVPDAKEIREMADTLGVKEPAEFMRLFF